MFGQCLIFVYLGLRSMLMLCEQAKIGEDGVLPEYLPQKGSGLERKPPQKIQCPQSFLTGKLQRLQQNNPVACFHQQSIPGMSSDPSRDRAGITGGDHLC